MIWTPKGDYFLFTSVYERKIREKPFAAVSFRSKINCIIEPEKSAG